MNTFILADYNLQLRTMAPSEYMESLAYNGNPYNLIGLATGEQHFHVFMTTTDILAMFSVPEHEGQRILIGRFLYEYLPDQEFCEREVEIGLTRAIRNAIDHGTKQIDVARLNDDSECFAEILLADPKSRLFSPQFKAMLDKDEHQIVTAEIHNSIADELKIATVMRRHSVFRGRAVGRIVYVLDTAIHYMSESSLNSHQAILKVKRFLTNFPNCETEEVKAKLQESDEALAQEMKRMSDAQKPS